MSQQQQYEIAKKMADQFVGSIDPSKLKKTPPPSAHKNERIIPTSVGNTRVLIFTPDKIPSSPLPVYFNMHGGGFVLGSADMEDVFCGMIAEYVGCVVVNIDYKLAPHYKFPAALNECYDVVKWIIDNHEQLHIQPDKIAIGGHSAGGNLAAAICLLNQQRNNELPILLQIIDFAPLDLNTDPIHKPNAIENLAKIARMFNSFYMNNEEEACNPLVSPIFAESLYNLPEALVITCELDTLATEGQIYATKLEQAGIKVTYRQYVGIDHGFTRNGEVVVEVIEESWHLMASKLKEVFTAS
ncbi:esterase [Paenibacillus borealis]|uniref:Esterase n=2 Tax=Paenibacillus TaxID=44249 RepID=A0ABX3GV59_PAEBO|nr:esterase [Paenibacillus borealis]